MERICTQTRTCNTETRHTRETSCGTTSYEYLHSSKACQAIDTEQEVYTNDLIQQKAQLEYERNQYMELNNELKMRILEWEEKYHAERCKYLALECSSKQAPATDVKVCQNMSTSTSNLCTINATITATSAKTSTKTSNLAQQYSSEDSSLVNSQHHGGSSECVEGGHLPVVRRRETEFEHRKQMSTTRTTRTQQDTIRVTATIRENGGDKTGEKSQWTAKTAQNLANNAIITLSTDKKNNIHRINIRSRSNSNEPPRGGTTVCSEANGPTIRMERGCDGNMHNYDDIDEAGRSMRQQQQNHQHTNYSNIDRQVDEALDLNKNIVHIDVNQSEQNSSGATKYDASASVK